MRADSAAFFHAADALWLALLQPELLESPTERLFPAVARIHWTTTEVVRRSIFLAAELARSAQQGTLIAGEGEAPPRAEECIKLMLTFQRNS